MKDLIISQEGQPLLTVDDLEVAQFIYTVLNNEKISSIIDNMRTKAVLILGSFDKVSLPLYEILKDSIRSKGFIPLLFDFKGPRTQELMETVRTMALLSNFIIVDLSVPSGQIHELKDLVPKTFIPFATIGREGTKVTSMHGEFKHYSWYRHDYFPYSTFEQIPQLLEPDFDS